MQKLNFYTNFARRTPCPISQEIGQSRIIALTARKNAALCGKVRTAVKNLYFFNSAGKSFLVTKKIKNQEEN